GSVLFATGIWLPLIHLGTSGWRLAGLNLRPESYEILMLVYAMLPLGISCDFLFIALTRYILTCAARSNSPVKITGLALFNVGLATVLVVAPIALGFVVSGVSGDPNNAIGIMLGLTALSNLLNVLVSLAWLFVGLAMLLHRIIWPLIERPI